MNFPLLVVDRCPPGAAALILLMALLGRCLAAGEQSVPTDAGWPRQFKLNGKQLTVYQPQVDYWTGYSNLHFRCAIAVKGVLKQERFGVVEVDAFTVMEPSARVVALATIRRDIRFPNCTGPELAALRQAVEELRPMDQPTALSFERVMAGLNPVQHATQKPVAVNLNPPKIFYSRQPAILVILMGKLQLKPVETNRTDLMFAINTNWELLYDTAGRRFFLLNGDHWLTAADVKGPWAPATDLPLSFSTLPTNGNWAVARKNLPGKRVKTAPAVYVSTEPAELIITQGEPSFDAIEGTGLMRVVNTDSTLFFNIQGEPAYYFMVAGRWFRARNLEGPWSAASNDLPANFASIPDDDPAAFVKASVPGTREARDAVLLASVPTTTTVQGTNATVTVAYSGAPRFVSLPNSVVQSAANSLQQVFLVDGRYYCCDGGVWFVSDAATGPWLFCTDVPAAIYAIPAGSPGHNVTYVTVQSATPTTVVYNQTAGYSGEYVAETGVLMFGAGMVLGEAAGDSSDLYFFPPYPFYYSYGCCATYHYGYGGYYYGGGACYGPYGGAGYSTAYNPDTGTYSRSAYAYGPDGTAGAQAAYNPYTGAYARSVQASTAYGSAGRAAGYNPFTGTSAASGYRSSPYGTVAGGVAYNSRTGAAAAGGSVSTASGSAARAAAYDPTTGQGARTAYRSDDYGSAGAMRTTSGAGAAAWNTAGGQGMVARTSSGDVYAAQDGTVYKREAGGGWSQNSGSGWENVNRQQLEANAWIQQQQNIEAQAQARAWANQQYQNAQAWQNGAHSWGGGSGGFNRGGGGGRRR